MATFNLFRILDTRRFITQYAKAFGKALTTSRKRMRNIIFRVFILSSFLTFSQNEKLDAVIYWRYVNSVNIFDKPNGTVINTIQNDTVNENLIRLTISKIENGFLKVKIGLEMDNVSFNGWIKSATYIGAYLRHEAHPMDLILYSCPKEAKDNIILLTDWEPDFITILDFEKDWVNVCVNYKGKRIMGWIQRNNLCANSYSTCS